MNLTEYKEIVKHRLEHDCSFEDSYDGTEYDIVAVKETEETLAFGEVSLNRTIFLVSFDCSEEYINSEIESLPSIVLSDFRSIVKNRNTTVIRVFVCNGSSYELVRKVKNYKFAKNEQRQYWYYAEGGIILSDLSDFHLYASSCADPFSRTFKVINPVEIEEDTVLPKKNT